MTEKQYLNVGDLVRVKPISDEVKASLAKNQPKMSLDSQFDNDIGIVVQVIESNNKNNSYVIVRWQKLEKEYSHFPNGLVKVC
jgi:hypothetical protein